MGGAGRHGASRRGQETSAERSPVMAGASGCMERVRDGTVALRRTTAGLLAAAGGGRCFKCRPGGRYFKHRPPWASFNRPMGDVWARPAAYLS